MGTEVKVISSKANPHVKRLLALKASRSRREQQKAVIYGVRELFRAWENGVAIEELYLCPDILARQDAVFPWSRLKAAVKNVVQVSAAVSARIAFGQRDEGVVAVATMPRLRMQDIEEKNFSFFLVVDAVEKPGNLGAILRSADAAGVDAVCVCDVKTDIAHPHCIRSSLGAVFGLPIVIAPREETAAFFQQQGARIVATSPKAETLYAESDLRSPIALVVGSEAQGLDAFWTGRADEAVCIPMLGQVDSLNVSVAAAVLLYEYRRQNGFVRRRPL